MNERDRNAADDWMRDHLPDPDQYSLEENEERRNQQLYVFFRFRDGATVIFRVAVKDGKVSSIKKEVYSDEVFEGSANEVHWIVKPQGRGHRRPKGGGHSHR